MAIPIPSKEERKLSRRVETRVVVSLGGRGGEGSETEGEVVVAVGGLVVERWLALLPGESLAQQFKVIR